MQSNTVLPANIVQIADSDKQSFTNYYLGIPRSATQPIRDLIIGQREDSVGHVSLESLLDTRSRIGAFGF